MGATVGQIYSEYSGKMGYTIGNFNKIISKIERTNEYVKITFTDGTETLARQAMVVYVKEEKTEDETEEAEDEQL